MNWVISRPSSQTSQPRPHAPSAGRGPVVLDEAHVVGAHVDAERLEAAEVELLRVARVGLEDHLELGVGLQPVRVLAVAGVVGAHARLDVGDAPRLRAEHAQEGGRVEGTGADLGVERLHGHSAAFGPVPVQREYRVLHRQHEGKPWSARGSTRGSGHTMIHILPIYNMLIYNVLRRATTDADLELPRVYERSRTFIVRPARRSQNVISLR